MIRKPIDYSRFREVVLSFGISSVYIYILLIYFHYLEEILYMFARLGFISIVNEDICDLNT